MQPGVSPVRRCAVIALQVVLQHQLPVGLHVVVLAVGNPGGGQVIGAQRRFDGFERRIERGRGRVAVDENQALEHRAPGPLQRIQRGVEVAFALHRPGGPEPAIQFVDPAVVGTDEGPAGALRTLADPGAPMPADIHQGMDSLLAVAHHDDGIFPEIVGEVVAGLRDLADVPRIEPALVQDLIEFLPVDHL